jgi:hypothetical protein
MPVVLIAMGAGTRTEHQAGCGQGKEEKALHRLGKTALRLWELHQPMGSCALLLTLGRSSVSTE